jgi:dTDP-L-rhamnose 4-epimerase
VTGVYSVTKYAHERIALALGRELSIPTVALRYALTYGPRQSLSNPYTGICSIFSMRILNGSPPVVFEDGLQTRDFTFVRDVAAANVLVSERKEADYEVFNVGTSIPTTVLNFVRTLARLYDRPEIEPTLPKEFRPLDLRHLVTDNRKLRRLGWNPRYSLEQGLAEYVSWIQSQERPEAYFEQALAQLRQLGTVRLAR